MKRTSCFVFQTEPDLLNCGGTIGTIQCSVSCNAGVVLYVLQAILNRNSSVILEKNKFPSDLILKFPNLLPRCVKRYVMTGGLRPLFGSGPICSPARVVRTVRAGISALCRPHQTQCWAGPGPCQLRTAAAGGVIRLQLLHGQDCCCRLLLRS